LVDNHHRTHYLSGELKFEKVSRKKNLPIIENVLVSDVAAEGKAIARINDMVVFITGVVPGDVVDIKVLRKRKSYMEAIAVKFKKYSEIRETPFCKHFGVCGGCKWQNLPYTEQLKYKQKQVEDSLQRIAKVKLPEISPIIASQHVQYYRNKLEFTFSCKRWITDNEAKSGAEITNPDALGFHIPGMFDKVLDIEECFLQPEPQNQLRLAIKIFALEKGISFFDLRTKEGLLRNVILRNSNTGQWMVIVVFSRDEKNIRDEFLGMIRDHFPQVHSLMYVINGKANDSIADLPVHLFSGADHIIEQMEDLQFKVGPKSFYQTNPEQAYNLYKTARQFAAISTTDVVYDLYTGTGTIANFVAHSAKKVIGIEYVPEAIEDAHNNSLLNTIDNTTFYAGDIKDMLSVEFFNQHGQPDVIITDPPRAGMHSDVTNCLLKSKAKRIVYVSCNPATQARDIAMLDEAYQVTAIQPVDMFPHTHHVENVVLLELR